MQRAISTKARSREDQGSLEDRGPNRVANKANTAKDISNEAVSSRLLGSPSCLIEGDVLIALLLGDDGGPYARAIWRTMVDMV